MADDRQSDPLSQIDRGQGVPRVDGVLEAAGDRVAGKPLQQVGHVVYGAASREVEMDAETPRRHLHHRPGLVEYVLERGEVELQPGVTLPGVAPHRLGHSLRVRRHRPAPHRYPGSVFLPEQLVDRHAGRLPHEVVHRGADRQGGFVPEPVERVAAYVLGDHLRRLLAALAEADFPAVGVGDVDGPSADSLVVGELPGRGSKWSGWSDSNRRPPAPKAGALTGLRYTPTAKGR